MGTNSVTNSGGSRSEMPGELQNFGTNLKYAVHNSTAMSQLLGYISHHPKKTGRLSCYNPSAKRRAESLLSTF
jgi:hypothetical protein